MKMLSQLLRVLSLFLLNFFIIVEASSVSNRPINLRCSEMVRRFDSCLISTFGQNELAIPTAEYLNRNFPQFLSILSGDNLTQLVQPSSAYEQESYLGSNVFRNCHDYNTLSTCLDFEFGQCLVNNFSSSAIFNFVRGLVRRHGGRRWEQIKFSDKQITDVTVTMDYLCQRKIGQLDKYRTCLLGVFQQNKALGFDAQALSEAARSGSEWSPRLCSQTQRFLNSLTFAVRRSCEADFAKAGANATAEVFNVINKVFSMAVESIATFSPQKCRLVFGAAISPPVSAAPSSPPSSSNNIDNDIDNNNKESDDGNKVFSVRQKPKSIESNLNKVKEKSYNRKKDNRPSFSVDYQMEDSQQDSAGAPLTTRPINSGLVFIYSLITIIIAKFSSLY